jgi:hypothetical protein
MDLVAPSIQQSWSELVTAFIRPPAAGRLALRRRSVGRRQGVLTLRLTTAPPKRSCHRRFARTTRAQSFRCPAGWHWLSLWATGARQGDALAAAGGLSVFVLLSCQARAALAVCVAGLVALAARSGARGRLRAVDGLGRYRAMRGLASSDRPRRDHRRSIHRERDDVYLGGCSRADRPYRYTVRGLGARAAFDVCGAFGCLDACCPSDARAAWSRAEDYVGGSRRGES